MKHINITLTIFFLLANLLVLGQSKSFQFRVEEGITSLDQSIFIQQSGKTRKITLLSADRVSFNSWVSTGKISQKDCDSLWAFLENYSFKHEYKKCKGGDTMFFMATALPDSLRVVINGDTIKKELLPWFGYIYNPATRNYFKLSYSKENNIIDDSKQITLLFRNEAQYNILQFEPQMIITEQDQDLSSFLIYLLLKNKKHFPKFYLNAIISEMNEKFK